MKLGASKVTLGAVEARLESLDKNWDKFDALNDDLLANHLHKLSKEEYMIQDVPALCEEAYLTNKGVLMDLRRTLQAKELAITRPAQTETPSSAPAHPAAVLHEPIRGLASLLGSVPVAHRSRQVDEICRKIPLLEELCQR